MEIPVSDVETPLERSRLWRGYPRLADLVDRPSRFDGRWVVIVLVLAYFAGLGICSLNKDKGWWRRCGGVPTGPVDYDVPRGADHMSQRTLSDARLPVRRPF